MKFTVDVLNSVAAGWLQFKKGNIKEAYICYERNHEKSLSFLMQKDSWYYGQDSYCIFIDGHYSGKFTKDAMDILVKHFFPGEYTDLNN